MVLSMRIVSVAVLAGVFASGVSPLRADQSTEQRASSAAADSQAVVGTYCAGCHTGVMRSPSGALLDYLDPARISANPDVWTRAYRQLQAGTMPPSGAPRPDRSGYDSVLTSIEVALGASAAPAADATSLEIADRLALMLWNSAPDPSLMDDAERDGLKNPSTLERHVKRMIADDRVSAFVARFLFPWLGLDQLGKADPDKSHFPDYDVSLRDAMARETELFLLSQLREDRDPVELWNANYTFLNEQLARHYGIGGITGAQFRRVASAPERAGLLGHGSVHMVTSRHQHGMDAGYTSPATRAIWVRLRFLGAAAPRPFPNAQPVKPDLPITPQTRTLPAEPCANCHRNFFPLGYALENFDPIGRWRTRDQAGPIDASGSFVDGTRTNGVIELRNVLLQRPEAFRTTITEQLLAYAAGTSVKAAGLTPDTLVSARRILRRVNAPRWSSIIAAIVRTKPQSEL
jgi:mono/diheme cytochrome c family protein